MIRKTLIITAGMIAAAQFSGPANASYMSTCKALITDWETCRETGSECKPETTKIEENCKCHVQKGDDWKLVMAAVAKDDVCGHPPEDIIIPPPPPPPPRLIKRAPIAGDAGDKGGGENKGDERH